MPDPANPTHPDRRSFLRTLMLAGAVPFIPTETLALGAPRSAGESFDASQSTATVASSSRAQVRFLGIKEALLDFWNAIDHLYEDKDYDFSDADINNTPPGRHSAIHPDMMRFATEFLSSAAGKTPASTGTGNAVDHSEPAPAVLFNPRMKSRELVGRMLCAGAGLDAQMIWTRPVSHAELIRLVKAAGQISRVPILIGETDFGTT